ncbi:MAG: CRISPR-associated endonuclease Cas2 [Hahellaceae bacterium]|nr:CRISPR-associated endonuclease Cas2 [Hahellaceae bacterium]
MNRDLYLAAYDITEPDRLHRSLEVLKDYAGGGQDSVFECYLSDAERRELVSRMESLMDPITDRFFIIPLDARGIYKALGCAQEPQDLAVYYVG